MSARPIMPAAISSTCGIRAGAELEAGELGAVRAVHGPAVETLRGRAIGARCGSPRASARSRSRGCPIRRTSRSAVTASARTSAIAPSFATCWRSTGRGWPHRAVTSIGRWRERAAGPARYRGSSITLTRRLSERRRRRRRGVPAHGVTEERRRVHARPRQHVESEGEVPLAVAEHVADVQLLGDGLHRQDPVRLHAHAGHHHAAVDGARSPWRAAGCRSRPRSRRRRRRGARPPRFTAATTSSRSAWITAVAPMRARRAPRARGEITHQHVAGAEEAAPEAHREPDGPARR